MRYPIFVLSALLTSASACGDDEDTSPGDRSSSASAASAGPDSGSSGGEGAAGASSSTSGSGASGGDSGSGGAGGSSSGSGGASTLGCSGTPPMGATSAKSPKAYSGGTCPTLPQVTTQDVALSSSGATRNFWLVVPQNLQPDEHLPVIFLWHWLNGGAQSFFEKGEVQAAVDEQRFLAIIPQEKGDLQFTWPYSVIDTAARLEEEAVFFDDMLGCVSQQFDVNTDCVSTAGVSAGALFSAQLVGVRGDWISSFMSLSGGTGGSLVKGWTAPAHKMPAFVLWGGPADNCFGIMNFVQTSQDLEEHLVQGGHFFLECVHNCGHAVPPFEPPPGSSRYKALWQFALDHPFWLGPGESPYSAGLPADLPPWCGVGPGSATPATGECIEGSGC